MATPSRIAVLLLLATVMTVLVFGAILGKGYNGYVS